MPAYHVLAFCPRDDQYSAESTHLRPARLARASAVTTRTTSASDHSWPVSWPTATLTVTLTLSQPETSVSAMARPIFFRAPERVGCLGVRRDNLEFARARRARLWKAVLCVRAHGAAGPASKYSTFRTGR